MQEGIGRGGYRMLATVFAAIGVLGLVVTLYAFGRASADGTPRNLFDWLGFGLSFAGLVAVYGLLMVVLWRRESTEAAARAAEPPLPAGAPPLSGPARPISFEFDAGAKPAEEEEHAIAVEEDEPAPAGRPPLARPAPVLPPNRNLQVDAKGWPQRKGPSGITRGQYMAERRGETIVPLQRTESGDVVMVPSPAPASSPRAASMVVRKEQPAVLAKLAPVGGDSDFTPDGMALGKCGGCDTKLLAPQERPLSLRCPKCGKVTRLT